MLLYYLIEVKDEVLYSYYVYYVYILQLKDKRFYIGYSADLKKRIKAHLTGGVPQTRNCRPLSLVYYSAFQHKHRAVSFEKYLKTGSGFAFRNKHFV